MILAYGPVKSVSPRFLSEGLAGAGKFVIVAEDCVVASTDPVYPVYCDSNVMAGRTGTADEAGSNDGLVYMPCTAENNFIPAVPEGHVDIIYFCSPNNPTGTVMTRAAMAEWIAYAKTEQAVILFGGDALRSIILGVIGEPTDF